MRTIQALVVAWTAAAVGALLLLLCTGASCGQSEVRTHAQIADALYEPLQAAKHIIEFRRQAEYDAAIRDATSPEDKAARIERLKRKWEPVAAAHKAAKTAQHAYVDGVAAAHESKQRKVGYEFALALLARWQSLIELAADAGLELPPVPPYLINEVNRGP